MLQGVQEVMKLEQEETKMRIMVCCLSGLLIFIFFSATTGFSAPDQFMGDASIYQGLPPVDGGGKPNVLFIIDNSSATENVASGLKYEPDTTYTQYPIKEGQSELYDPVGIYSVDQQGDFTQQATTLSELNCTGVDAGNNPVDVIRSTLLTYGTYTAAGSAGFPALAQNGGGCASNSGGAVYALGNYLNYLKTPAVAPTEDEVCADPIVVKSCKNPAQCGFFQLKAEHTPTCEPATNNCSDSSNWWSPPSVTYNAATVPVWTINGNGTDDGSGNPAYLLPDCYTVPVGNTQREIFYEAIRTVVGAAAGAVNFAAMSYDQGGQKGGIITAGMDNLAEGIESTYNSATGVWDYDIPDCENTANADLAQCVWLKKIPGPDRNADGDYYNDNDTDGYTILSSQTSRPQAEALFDAGYYFGAFPTSGGISPNAIQMADDDPMRNQCGLNHIILITNGLSNESTRNVFTSLVGDADNDGWEDEGSYGLGTHWLDDTAKILQSFNGITTHTVLAFQADDPLLKNAATVDGGGEYYNVQSANELAAALGDLLGNIVNTKSTSFVAPVVPASTTNRTVSSNRVYLGLFRPQQDGNWHGNIKKYGINKDNQLTEPPQDTSVTIGDVATDPYGAFDEDSISFWSLQDGVIPAMDSDSYPTPQDGVIPAARLDIDPSLGDDNAILGDGGVVDAGGAGGVLLKRMRAVSAYIKGGGDITDASSNKRKIFTFDESAPATPIMLDWYNTDLTPGMFALPDTSLDWWDGSAGMSTLENAAFSATPPTLTLDEIKMRNLLRYLHGFQSTNVSSTDIWNNRNWIMGDVLHSRPVVFNFSKYDIAKEGVCSRDSEGNIVDATGNSSYVFVGTNDGMLHAFRDCDGSEAWGFVPQNVLENLKYLPDDKHTSFVDSAPSVFYFDINGNGDLSDSGDAAILIVGQRRGGGKDNLDSSSRGSYYALDISDPENPEFLWEFSIGESSELAETWSLPKVGKVKVPDTENEYRWLAFITAGYDNNEDFRFGNTQEFPTGINSTTSVSNAPTGGSVDGTDGSDNLQQLTSPGGSTTGYAMRGKGLLAIEVGYSTKNSTTGKYETVVSPSERSSIGTAVWSYTPSLMKYSFASDIRALDLNMNGGWLDRFYVGDTGGNLWRVDTTNRDTTQWAAEKIFLSNSDGSDTYSGGYINGTPDNSKGRKLFYPPSVASSGASGDPWVCFSTGDREHPLNLAVTDRLYCIRDYGQTSTDEIDESDLVDVTDNHLQEASGTVDGVTVDQQISAITGKLYSRPGSPVNDAGEPDPDGKVYYGWYIRLDGKDRNANGDPGEKALAEPVIFNNEVFYSTYQIKMGTRANCEAGNLGWSRLYRVNLETGEAVFNYYIGNDTDDISNNERAAGGENVVLKRRDRVYELGEGIPSGVVQIVDETGRVGLLISSSDKVEGISGTNASVSFPLYWMQW
jgi:type IV pilus assembly protein PilY1